MSDKKVFSFIKGYSFSFDVEEGHINVWFSAFSGLEKVFVDGSLVSSQRNYSTDSSNTFKLGNHEYSTTLKVENLLTGPFVCTLTKNGKAIKRQKLVFTRLKPKNIKRVLLFYVFLGGAFGLYQNYFNISDSLFYIFLAFVFFMSFLFDKLSNRNNMMKPVIENMDIYFARPRLRISND